MMSPEQSYLNALRKSALLGNRAVRYCLDGKINYVEGDYDRKCLIDALRLGYEAGLRDGKNKAKR